MKGDVIYPDAMIRSVVANDTIGGVFRDAGALIEPQALARYVIRSRRPLASHVLLYYRCSLMS